MEGLLPMVYKAIKKNRVRSKYECLSSGGDRSFNIADFYPDRETQLQQYQYQYHHAPPSHKVSEFSPDRNSGAHLHRRHKSVGHFSLQESRKEIAGHQTPKHLMRIKSHGRMFSCISGV